MALQSMREFQSTQQKLQLLEESYAEAAADTSLSEQVREIELRSLRQLINQLTEESTRFKSRAKTTGPSPT